MYTFRREFRDLINSQESKKHKTALHYVIKREDSDAALILLKKGADFDLREQHYDKHTVRNHGQYIISVDSAVCVQLLGQYSAKPQRATQHFMKHAL